jgi:AcrR family transcriptional regulator
MAKCWYRDAVGRKPNPDRKPELLEAVVGYVAEHGLGDLSLRPLAEALGVSTYTLVYHFGSKEQLVVEVLASVEARQKVLVERWIAGEPELDLATLVRRYWAWASAPENLPLLRLVFEAVTLSATASGLPGDVRARLVTDWVDGLAAGFAESGSGNAESRTLATLVNAAFTGLVLDLLATGDHARVEAALDALLAQLPVPARA